MADYAGIDRSTYIHYEEAGRDYYPKEHMEKLAELFEVPLEDLLDDYNLFLLRGQGEQIKVQIFKSTWEKYFKQGLEKCE